MGNQQGMLSKVACVCAMILLLDGGSATAQLTWGLGGGGGDGSWDVSSANWWNGANNVPWTSGSDAVFAGTGGTVSSYVFGPTVASLTFDSPGYTIQNGWLRGGVNGLTVITNADATIDSVLNRTNYPTGDLFTKTGSGALTVGGTNFFGNVEISGGEYIAGGYSGLFFSKVRVEDAAVLTLSPPNSTTDIGSLSGGGDVRPDSQARTVTVTLWGAQDYTGSLQDNGAGTLAVNVFTSTSVELLAPNTYSGATKIESGTLRLWGNGALANSAVTVRSGGTLLLDNSIGASDRLSDSASMTLQGGKLQMLGGREAESTGGLILDGGAGKIIITPQSGVPAGTLKFTGITRQSSGTLNVSGSGVSITGLTNGVGGIVASYLTIGTDWAVTDTNGLLTAFTGYSTDINAGASPTNVKIATSGVTNLTASRSRYTLNLESPNGSSPTVLDLGGHDLQLIAGGVLSSGAGAAVIQNGNLYAGTELDITSTNALTISASIQNAGTTLVKSGAGVLTLQGSNSYSGPTVINEGTLVVGSSSNLGSGQTVQFGGGTLKASGSFSSSKGLTSGSESGTIDTSWYSVTFNGPNTGSISKIGAGVLTLGNAAVGDVSVSSGLLALPNATSGSASLDGGTLMAAGKLSQLWVYSNSTLDIAGNGAGTLQTDDLSMSGGEPHLTVFFDLGSSSQDLWTITDPWNLSPSGSASVIFNFRNLGGLATGVDYTLIAFTGYGSFVNASTFALAPELSDTGWSATFQSTPSAVTVNFSAIPEPAPILLLVLGGVALLTASGRGTRLIAAFTPCCATAPANSRPSKSGSPSRRSTSQGRT